MEQVISLNWRNDYMDSIPLQYRPDVVMGRDPWAHYDRNPDHRKVARVPGVTYSPRTSTDFFA